MIYKKSVHVKRSPVDRRNPDDRRVVNIGPTYPNKERRIHRDRRRCFEDRHGWKRITKWVSSPVFPEIP